MKVRSNGGILGKSSPDSGVCVRTSALVVRRVQVEEDVEVPKRHHPQHPWGDCLQRAHHVQEHTSPRALCVVCVCACVWTPRALCVVCVWMHVYVHNACVCE